MKPGAAALRKTDTPIDEIVGQMPIVRRLVDCLKADGFSFDSTTLLFGVQHLMEQSLVLCWALNELGLPYERIALAGKPYSTNPDVVERLLSLGVMVQEPRDYDLLRAQAQEQVEDIRRLAIRFAEKKASFANPTALILDDGGHALSHFTQFVPRPYKLAGVEQTASGFWQPGFHTVSFPVVDVGASAVKRVCEPRVIAEAALRRVDALFGNKTRSLQIGIVGLGYIGAALCRELTRRGARPLVFDVRADESTDKSSQDASALRDLFDRSDVIFGCTGVDITRSMILDAINLAHRNSERLLISLSSGDDEFFSLKAELLVDSSQYHSYQLGDIPDVCGQRWGVPFRIVRNGFPINFDNSGQSVPLSQIQGTIAALVAATCQTYMSACRTGSISASPQRTMLDPKLQRWLFRKWNSYLPNVPDLEGSRMHDLVSIASLSTKRTLPASVEIATSFGDWTERNE